MLQPFNTVLFIVVTPNHKIILLLLHNCNFATAMDCKANISYAGMCYADPQVENGGFR